METLGERIRSMRKNKGLSQAALARMVGVKSQAVNQWESGAVAEIKGRNLITLAKALDSTPEYIRTGKGGEPHQEDEDFHGMLAAEGERKCGLVKKYNAKISAGPESNNDEYAEASHSHPFHADWLEKKGYRPEDFWVVDAKGDSMSPTINDGDILLVNAADGTIRSGKIYVISFPNDGDRPKRLFWLADGRLRVSSDNPDKARYPDEDYNPSQIEHLKIIGRVVHKAGDV